jgi:1,4-alpha-glucan branching enzyme
MAAGTIGSENLDSKVLAYTRWNDEGSRVVIVANFSEQFLADYNISHFPTNDSWHK